MKRRIFITALLVSAVVLTIIYNRYGVTLALPHDEQAKVTKSPLEIGEEATIQDAVETFLLVQGVEGEGLTIPDIETPNPVDYIKLTPEGHFYNEDIEISMLFDMEGVSEYEICFTNDGTEPVKGRKKYTEPFNYTATRNAVNINCLKIKVFYTLDGEELETSTLTHTYFVGDDLKSRFDTLVFSISTDPYNLFDYEYGIFVPGKLRADFIKQNLKKDIVPPDPANYNIRGIEGERTVYVEVFESDGTRVLAQGAGVRVHGNWSRDHVQKSMKLIAKKIYEPLQSLGKFHYNFFEGASSVSSYPNVAAFDEYESIVLRNGANDFNNAFMRDELSATLARKAGFPDSSYYRPVSIYLNGSYYGFSWMHQVFDIDYLQQNYQAPDANFAIMNFYETDKSNCGFDADEGPENAVADFKEFYSYRDKDMTDDTIYEEFCKLVDIDNLTLYYAMQCYIDNRDWPRGNMKAWRYYGESDGSSEYLDGKWRFLFYDNEFAWSLYENKYDNNTFKRLIGLGDTYNGGTSNILKALMKRPSYPEKFANTLCDLANDSFSYQNVVETVDYLASIQENELRTAINSLSNYHDWGIEGNRNTIKKFAERRPAAVYKHLKDYFKLSTMYTITVAGAEGINSKLNSIPIDGAQTKTSEYFAEYTVPLSAEEKSGHYEFKHWIVNGKIIEDKELILDIGMCVDGEIVIELVSEKKDVSPVIIREVYPSGNSDWIKVYNNSDTVAHVGGLHLTDDMNNPNKWTFPEMVIDSNSDLLLICNNNKNTDALLNIALPFSVREGEILYLTDKDGAMLTRIKIPDMNKNEVLSYNFDEGLYHIIPLQ